MSPRFIGRLARHRLTQNSLQLWLVQAVNLVTPLALMLHFTSRLGTEVYGVVAFSMAISQVTSILIDLGFSLSATRAVAEKRNDPAARATFSGSVYVIKLAVFAVIACVVVVYAFWNEKYEAYTPIFLLSLLPMLGMALQPIWLFIGVEKMGGVALITVTSKAVFCILGLTLVNGPEDYYLVPVSDGAGQLLAATFGIYLLHRSGYAVRIPALREVAAVFRMTLGFFASRIAVVSYQNTGVVILGLIGTPQQAGILSIADQFYRAIQCIFAPVGQAMYPYMVAERNFSLYLRLSKILSIAAVVIASLVALVMPFLAPSLLGRIWDGVMPVLYVFLAGTVITTLNMITGYPLAAALRRVHVANRSVLFGAAAFGALLGLGYFVGKLTPVTLALSVVSAEAVVLFVRASSMWPSLLRKAKAHEA